MPEKRLDRLSDALRAKHYSYHFEEAYLNQVRRYILFHHKTVDPKAVGSTPIGHPKPKDFRSL